MLLLTKQRIFETNGNQMLLNGVCQNSVIPSFQKITCRV